MESERRMAVPTALGSIVIAWSAAGLTRVSLPDPDATDPVAGQPGAPPSADVAAGPAVPPFAADLAVSLARYAEGTRVDFAAVPLALAGARAFDLPVWSAARAIPWGEAITYGELARRLGPPYVARAVGQALGRNPVPIVVPCHRIVATGFRLGGFSAPGGARTKERLLALESVAIEAPAPLLDLLHATPQR